MSMPGTAHRNRLLRARTSHASARPLALPTCRRPLQPATARAHTSHSFTHPQHASHAPPALCHSHPTRARLPGPRRALSRRSGMPRFARSLAAAAASHAAAFAVLAARSEVVELPGGAHSSTRCSSAAFAATTADARAGDRRARPTEGRRAENEEHGRAARIPGRRAGPLYRAKSFSRGCPRDPCMRPLRERVWHRLDPP